MYCRVLSWSLSRHLYKWTSQISLSLSKVWEWTLTQTDIIFFHRSDIHTNTLIREKKKRKSLALQSVNNLTWNKSFYSKMNTRINYKYGKITELKIETKIVGLFNGLVNVLCTHVQPLTHGELLPREIPWLFSCNCYSARQFCHKLLSLKCFFVDWTSLPDGLADNACGVTVTLT